LTLADQAGSTSAEVAYVIVPILDGIAAYLNYNAWTDTNDDW